MKPRIDLNADLGELPGPEGRASDRAIMEHITSCAIACGGHAGDAESMALTLQAAKEMRVQAGAHPSYPDRAHFGRRSLSYDLALLAESLAEQIASLAVLADEAGLGLYHVKPHGALYNDAARDQELAEMVVRVVKNCLPGASLIGQPGLALHRAAQTVGVGFLAEGFIDRTYQSDGTLTPRSEAGAVIGPLKKRAAQAKALALAGQVHDVNGKLFAIRADTLCLHGDSPDAAETAALIASTLKDEGVVLAAPDIV